MDVSLETLCLYGDSELFARHLPRLQGLSLHVKASHDLFDYVFVRNAQRGIPEVIGISRRFAQCALSLVEWIRDHVDCLST